MNRLFISLIGFVIFALILYNCLKHRIEHFLEFIHIPKNAGTTIENIGDKVNIKWGRFKPEHYEHKLSDSKLSNKCTYWHLPPKEFNDNSLYKSNPTFCVLRDPYDRVVSEYKYRNQREIQTPEKMNAWIKEMMIPENYEDGGLNCHFLPQSDFIYDKNDTITCDNVLRFDNLTSEFNDLTETHAIDLKMNDESRYNVTKKSVTSADLDDDVKDLIYHIYKRDFEVLTKKKAHRNRTQDDSGFIYDSMVNCRSIPQSELQM